MIQYVFTNREQYLLQERSADSDEFVLHDSDGQSWQNGHGIAESWLAVSTVSVPVDVRESFEWLERELDPRTGYVFEGLSYDNAGDACDACVEGWITAKGLNSDAETEALLRAHDDEHLAREFMSEGIYVEGASLSEHCAAVRRFRKVFFAELEPTIDRLIAIAEDTISSKRLDANVWTKSGARLYCGRYWVDLDRLADDIDAGVGDIRNARTGRPRARELDQIVSAWREAGLVITRG